MKRILSKVAIFLTFILLSATCSIILSGCKVKDPQKEAERAAKLAQMIEDYKDREFDERMVGVLLTNEVSINNIKHKYTVRDFPEIKLSDMYESSNKRVSTLAERKVNGETLTEDEEEKLKKFNRAFWLTLKVPSRENVLKAIILLQERTDVFAAEPNDIVYALETGPDTYIAINGD